jgi:hypothetical protein
VMQLCQTCASMARRENERNGETTK